MSAWCDVFCILIAIATCMYVNTAISCDKVILQPQQNRWLVQQLSKDLKIQ